MAPCNASAQQPPGSATPLPPAAHHNPTIHTLPSPPLLQVFTAPTVDRHRDSRTMLIDLQYPGTRAPDSAASSPVKTPPSTPGKTTGTPPCSPLPPQLGEACPSGASASRPALLRCG
jgi:hypothetical protein